MHLVLDHPPVNVLSSEVLDQLIRRLAEAGSDAEARAVVLESANPKAFAAGADIREMAEMSPSEARRHGGRGQAVTRRIERLPLPVLAAVHGACLGGGCEIALACDLVIASEDAQFGQPEIQLGVMPGWGGTRRLPRRIGATRAREWIYLGRPVPASEALAQGLVAKVVPRAELLPTTLALAQELAQRSPIALAAAKAAVLRAIDPSVDDGLAFELDLWSRLFGTQGQREGMAAFLAKRTPPPGDRRRWREESLGLPWSGGPERPAGRKGDKRGAASR